MLRHQAKVTLDRANATLEITKVIVVLLRPVVEGAEEILVEVLGGDIEVADDFILPPLVRVVESSNRLHDRCDVGLRGRCR